MTERLTIDFRAADGALLRLLGLIERRGFRVAALDLIALPGGRARLTATLTARDGARVLETLGLQLRRLQEVERVAAASAYPVGAAA